MSAQSHYRLIGLTFPPRGVDGRSAPPVPLIVSLPLVRHLSAQGRRKKRQNTRGQGGSHRQATTISVLPNDVLLEIFDFYRHETDYDGLWEWHLLVHVCQRWRQIVFASPHRLDLRILCTNRNPIREDLGIWPVLPIILSWRGGITPHEEDNAIAALEHPDRVLECHLVVTGSQLERIATMVQVPFPALTNLEIRSKEGNAPVLPAEFLGGSAPCLQKIFLHGIPFPELPTLLSTSDLVTLGLWDIPKTGYISPEAMFECLAALPRLCSIHIEFRSATPRPDRIHLPPVTRTVLPALTYFQFRGASEYLEDLVSRIDAPELNRIYTYYLNQFVDFQVGQLSQFIHRSVGPKLTLSRHALITFDGDRVSFDTSRYPDDPYPDPPCAVTSILCQGIDWQASHMAQVLSQFSATLSNVIHVKLRLGNREKADEVEGTGVGWLHLLQQFPAMRTLRTCWKLGRHVALALEDMTAEMVAEFVPSLDLIYLQGYPAPSVEKFVAARKLSGHPVTVHDPDGETEFEERLVSYVSNEENNPH